MIYKGYAGAGNRIIFHLEEGEDDAYETRDEIYNNFSEQEGESEE